MSFARIHEGGTVVCLDSDCVRIMVGDLACTCGVAGCWLFVRSASKSFQFHLSENRQVKKARFIFLSCFILGLFSLSFGQQISQRKFEHRGKIESRYDASTNKTKVVLNPYDVPVVDTVEASENRQYFSIMCGFVYEGKKMTSYPETIELHIISDGTRGFKFNESQDRVLSIDIDEELIRLGTMSLVRSQHYAYGSSPVNYARSG